MAKTRNPQDATLRNIRAIKKRVDRLEARVRRLWIGFPRASRAYGLRGGRHGQSFLQRG
jgi:hypothetical protein